MAEDKGKQLPQDLSYGNLTTLKSLNKHHESQRDIKKLNSFKRAQKMLSSLDPKILTTATRPQTNYLANLKLQHT